MHVRAAGEPAGLADSNVGDGATDVGDPRSAVEVQDARRITLAVKTSRADIGNYLTLS
jgi:hypothetical protein